MGIKSYMFGTGVYSLQGADPEGCLNKISHHNITLWNIDRKDTFSVTFSAPLSEEKNLTDLSEKAYCNISLIKRYGLVCDLRKLLHRPFLLLSVLGAFCLTFLLESLIWNIQIHTDSDTIELQIRHVLQDYGVDIWTKSKTMEPQSLRYHLLNEIPELSWVAVNRKGGKLTVLAIETESEEQKDRSTFCHLIAARDGVITESIVLEGMDLVKVGDSVKQGQVLISGIEDYGLYMKAVRAEGEIYGQTWYQGTLVTPSTTGVKQYTGRSRQEIRILFGRKSINLSGSSSNLGVTCDKIIDTKQFSLPGYSFPLSLQRVTYREYTVIDDPMPQDVAQDLLCHSWESCLLSTMVAGRIEKTTSVCFEKGGLYVMQGESICHELLSRPIYPMPSEKGADPIGTDH